MMIKTWLPAVSLPVVMLIALFVGSVSVEPAQVVAVLLESAGLGRGDQRAAGGNEPMPEPIDRGQQPTDGSAVKKVPAGRATSDGPPPEGAPAVDVPPVDGANNDRRPDLTVARLIVNQVRLPRVLVAAGAGAALSLAGLLMQTVFRNPLAGPGVLGVTAGAGLGVAFVLMTGLGAHLSAPAFFAAMTGAAVVLLLAMAVNRIVAQPVILLVLGLLFGYAANAVTTLLMASSPAEGLQRYVVWSFGSFALPPGPLPTALPVIAAAATVALVLLGDRLDALLLGPSYAESLGVHARRYQGVLILAAGVLTGLVTAMTGPIAFLGVAVPHLARGYLRTSIHRRLVPVVAFLGATLAVIADLIARLPGSERVLPLNAVMALIGVPVVLIVVLRPTGAGSFGELEL